jgi:DNA-binding NarL/FixJ family response regulator
MHYSDQLIKEIVDAGVRGFVVKSDSDRDLLIALEALSNHKPFFTTMASEVLLTNFPRPKSIPGPGEIRASRLTPR